MRSAEFLNRMIEASDIIIDRRPKGRPHDQIEYGN